MNYDKPNQLFESFAIVIFITAFLFLFAVSSVCAQSSDNIASLLGDWSGESICMNKDKFPACKDETVVYHIKRVHGKANTVNLSADKIVNGKPESMGDFDFIYLANKRVLITDFKNERVHLTIAFDVKGDTLEGGMFTFPEKIQARKIKVKKEK